MASIRTRTRGGRKTFVARYTGADGREHNKTFSTERAARDHLNAETAKLVRGEWVDPKAGAITFAKYAEQYVAKQHHHERGTEVVVAYRLDNHIIPVIGNRQLKTITEHDIDNLIKVLKAKPKIGAATIGEIYKTLRAIFNAAVRDNTIARTPCVNVNLPKVKRAPIVPPTTEEVVAVIDTIEARYQAFVVLLAGAGVRYGEAAGLRVEDFDALRGVVHVRQQLLVGPLRVDEPKAASYRSIPIPKVVVDALARHLALHPARDDGDGFGKLMFRSATGRPMYSATFNLSLKNALKGADITRRITPHSFRHYYAAMLIRQGLSVKVLQTRLGHSKAETTLSYYAHLWADDEDRTREAVEEMLGAALAPKRRGLKATG